MEEEDELVEERIALEVLQPQNPEPPFQT